MKEGRIENNRYNLWVFKEKDGPCAITARRRDDRLEIDIAANILPITLTDEAAKSLAAWLVMPKPAAQADAMAKPSLASPA